MHKQGSSALAHESSECVSALAAVSAAIFRDSEVLLVRRGCEPGAGLWSLPGGHIKPGETALAAAMRELAEETSVEAEIYGVADAVDVIRHDADGRVTFHRVVVVFCGAWRANAPIAGSDAAAAAWHKVDGLHDLPVTAGLKSVVACAWTKAKFEQSLQKAEIPNIVAVR